MNKTKITGLVAMFLAPVAVSGTASYALGVARKPTPTRTPPAPQVDVSPRGQSDVVLPPQAQGNVGTHEPSPQSQACVK